MDEIYNHPQYYDMIFGWDITREIDFLEKCFRKYCSSKVRNILDIPCGTGRFLFPLIQRGYHVTGIDLNYEMLNYLKNESKTKKIKTNVIRADMRNFFMKPYYQAAICMFDSFRYLTTYEDMMKMLTCVSKSLEKDGIFIIDIGLVRNIENIFSTDDKWKCEKNGIEITASYKFTPPYDSVNQTVIEEVTLKVWTKNNSYKEITQRTPKKLISVEEIKMIVEKCENFKISDLYSDFNIDKLFVKPKEAERLVAVLQKI